MYVTDRDCEPAGPFRGRLVVSMRPIPESRVDEAVRISDEQPLAHGAPVHAGDPAALGHRATSPGPTGGRRTGGSGRGEVPVFWACGVTSQVVARNARPGLMNLARAGLHVRHRRPGIRAEAPRPRTRDAGRPVVSPPSSDESGGRRAERAFEKRRTAARRKPGQRSERRRAAIRV